MLSVLASGDPAAPCAGSIVVIPMPIPSMLSRSWIATTMSTPPITAPQEIRR
jgi:hypothetical protein